MKRSDWRHVPMRELREIWATQKKQGILFNGCTNAELVRRHGSDNVRHVCGKGWFTRRPTHQRNEDTA